MAPLHSCVQSPPCSADFSGASSQCCLLLSYELLCCSFILSSLIQSSDSLQDGIFQCWLSSPSSVYSSLLLLGPTSGNVCWGRKDLGRRSSVSPGTGAACQPLPLGYALSPFFPLLILPASDGNRATVWGEERAVGEFALVFQPCWHHWSGIQLKELSLRLQCQGTSGGLSLAGSGSPPSCLLTLLPQQNRQEEKSHGFEVQGAHLTINKTGSSWGKLI